MSPDAMAPVGDAYLVVQYRGHTIRTVPLPPSVLSVGRTPDNGLALDDPLVGARHAELEVKEGAILLTDLGEGHTLLAGGWVPPHQPTLVPHGTAIQIGPFVLTVTRDAMPAPAETDADAGHAHTFAPPPPLPQRVADDATLPVRGQSAYLKYLPVIFHDGDFLGRYLQIFEALWEPHEYRQNHLETYFDPLTAPPGMVGWLSGWTAADLPLPTDDSARRRGAREAYQLARWRGTRYGMTRALELLAQAHVTITEDPLRPHCLTVVVHVVHGAPDRALIERVLEWSRPAHCLVTLELMTPEVA